MPTKKRQKTVLEKWQTWVTLVIGLLTIVSIIVFDLPQKIIGYFKKEPPLVLSGVIWDEEREPLAGVTVRLREFDMTDTTNQNGEFGFHQIRATKQQSVNIIAQKEGYETYDTNATLGNTAFNFTMKVKPLVLSGVIWNEKHEPLAGVTVRLPELSLTDTTNQDGEFRFQVKATKQQSVNLIAQKEGYETYNTNATGDTTFNFTMRRKDRPVSSRLPEKEHQVVEAQVLQTLSGVIWDENHEPLAGVTVRLRELDMTDTTNQDGEFRFQVKATKQRSVNLIARKGGYETYDTDATLGNTAFNFTMRRKK